MHRKMLVCAMSLLASGMFVATNAVGDGSSGKGHNHIKAPLRAANEVPIVISDASGTLEIDIDEANQQILYELSYEDLEGTVTQAHIHIGQRFVAGGIAMWLCQTATNPAPAAVVAITPVCPGPNSGTVSGTLTAANVIGPANQAVPAGAFGDVLAAIRGGHAYGNVHSTSAPGGEIRGQLR